MYITKIGGVSISDCINLTKALNTVLDADESLIQGHYTLEVSSPGVERPLKFKKHYISAINEHIRITYQNQDKKDTIEGELLEISQEFVKIQTLHEQLDIPFSSIKKAKTVLTKK